MMLEYYIKCLKFDHILMGNCLLNPKIMVLRAKNEQAKPYGDFRRPKNGSLVFPIVISISSYATTDFSFNCNDMIQI